MHMTGNQNAVLRNLFSEQADIEIAKIASTFPITGYFQPRWR